MLLHNGNGHIIESIPTEEGLKIVISKISDQDGDKEVGFLEVKFKGNQLGLRLEHDIAIPTLIP